MKIYALILLLLLLAGCASNVPDAVRLDIGERLSVAEAQQRPQALAGKRVRWGGEILAVNNHRDFSDVVILRRELFNGGEPRPGGGEAKRFIARFDGFIDPAEFAVQQRLTVVGQLAGIKQLPVGEFRYAHPVVRVEQAHRWAKYVPVREPAWHRDPFYCDPIFPWGFRRPYCW
jgi:outer membrane lipoprotein